MNMYHLVIKSIGLQYSGIGWLAASVTEWAVSPINCDRFIYMSAVRAEMQKRFQVTKAGEELPELRILQGRYI